MMVEIQEEDLSRVLRFWRSLDALTEITARTYFTKGVRSICEHSIKKRSLDPYLRRLHITVHCGAKSGSEQTAQLAYDTMYELGSMIADYGFNFWYGGGDQGLMGAAMKGFMDRVNQHRFPAQYSIQIIPASFIEGVVSVTGLRPANEGLCKETDIAIVMPDFVSRRELLSSKCASAITGLEGVGSLDELTDILVHIKTGLRSTLSYILNPNIPQLGRGLWDPLKDLLTGMIAAGFERETTLEHVHFLSNSTKIMDDLMRRLEEKGENPHIVYQATCKTRGVTYQPQPESSLESGPDVT